MWHFLCRYGSSQGNFPKALIKLYLPSIFTHYFCKFFHDTGVESQVIIPSEPNRRIEKFLIYCLISIKQTFRHFSFEEEAQLNALASLLGSMSVFGIWTRMPRQNAERAIRVMDAVNCLSKAVVFVALSQVKIRIHAFKRVVGQHTDNQWLAEQIQSERPHEHGNDHGIQTRNMVNISIGSKFDSNGTLYEVVEVLPNTPSEVRGAEGGSTRVVLLQLRLDIRAPMQGIFQYINVLGLPSQGITTMYRISFAQL
jgi:hypothetical protein